jgi:16S rRNA (guanine527-N7)-methyltransferase
MIGGLADDVAGQLADLCGRYGLSDGTAVAIGALLGLLASDPHAPTTVTSPKAAIDTHIADSLVALELPFVAEARLIADLGAGAGFPGLALAAALRDARISLVESNGRKAAFIGRAIAAAGLTNAEAVCARAEDWPTGVGRHDLVTARALAPLNVVAEYAAPLLAPGGHLLAWSGRRDAVAEAEASRAAEILGLSTPEVIPVTPFSGAENRHLHVLTKIRPTPPAYPRRAGMARKRPLGGSAAAV